MEFGSSKRRFAKNIAVDRRRRVDVVVKFFAIEPVLRRSFITTITNLPDILSLSSLNGSISPSSLTNRRLTSPTLQTLVFHPSHHRSDIHNVSFSCEPIQIRSRRSCGRLRLPVRLESPPFFISPRSLTRKYRFPSTASSRTPEPKSRRRRSLSSSPTRATRSNPTGQCSSPDSLRRTTSTNSSRPPPLRDPEEELREEPEAPEPARRPKRRRRSSKPLRPTWELVLTSLEEETDTKRLLYR